MSLRNASCSVSVFDIETSGNTLPQQIGCRPGFDITQTPLLTVLISIWRACRPRTNETSCVCPKCQSGTACMRTILQQVEEIEGEPRCKIILH